MIHLLLGVRKQLETDGIRLLKLIMHRYGVSPDLYCLEYCYDGQPPSKLVDRLGLLVEARARLEIDWVELPGIIIGFGWMPCELLTGKRKTKLKRMTGTKWTYVGNIKRTAWITYDPNSCLYDPALAVDIAAVIVAAGQEEGLSMKLVTDNGYVSQLNSIWKRYL